MLDVSTLNFDKGNGLISVVTQDAQSGQVLMVAFADREAIEKTLATGEMHYRSRSRGLWHKGATSGHTQKVISLTPDCDGDALLARVDSNGPACHNNTTSCFDGAPLDTLSALDATIAARAAEKETAGKGYTQKLLGDRNLRLKKIGEEGAEFVLACADGDTERAKEEAADIVYHVLAALRPLGLGLADIRQVLRERAK